MAFKRRAKIFGGTAALCLITYGASKAGLLNGAEDRAAFGNKLTEQTTAAFTNQHPFEMSIFGQQSVINVGKYGSEQRDIPNTLDRIETNADWTPNQDPRHRKIAACATALITLKQVGLNVSPEAVQLYNAAGEDLQAANQCVTDIVEQVNAGTVAELRYVTQLN